MSKPFSRTEPIHTSREQAFAHRLEQVAWLMDRAFVIPGTKVRVGLDAILGLLPIGGDVLTGIVQAGLVLVALGHYRVPKSVALRMVANVLLDVGVGSIPILGDLFDVAFKANTRNLQLLEPYRPVREIEVGGTRPTISLPLGLNAPRPGAAMTSWGCLLPAATALLGALVLVLIGFVTVVRWILQKG